MSTHFQEVNDKGKANLNENVDEDDSGQQEHSRTMREKNLSELSDRSLRMRYRELGPLLRECLVFLSVFPGNEFVKKRTLIYWWIGEGWVKPAIGQTAEQVGEECFKMLLLNGLIEPFSKKHDRRARGCKINPLVHRMLISIAANDNSFAFDSHNKPTVNTEKCKRACLATDKKEQVVEVSLDPKPNNVLSLFNVNARYLICGKSKFSSLKSIAVLQLGRWQSSAEDHIQIEDTKFLDSLGILENLTYLSLQGISGVRTLPDSCMRLTNLQILDLRGCHHLETLPNEIMQLKNLTHLDVSECPLLERMPKGLSALLELQVLKGFVLNNGIVDGVNGLNELTNLKSLRKLSIRAVASTDMSEFRNFGSLRSLTICWVQKTLSPLTLPPALEKLDLQLIPQCDSLDWLGPENHMNLKKLYIRGGKLRSLELGTKMEKWNVEILRLRFLNELKSVDWSQLEKVFPSLTFIEIYKCPNLELKPAFLGPPIHEDGEFIMKKQA